MVDDEPDIRRLNTEVVIESGYHVDSVEDGVSAWEALNTNSYDLLITDNHMPTVTGLELIKKLRAEDMKLPVILMSATMPTEELKRHPWLEIQATLLKPYALAELFITVKEVLGVSVRAREQINAPSNWQNLPTTAGLRL